MADDRVKAAAAAIQADEDRARQQREQIRSSPKALGEFIRESLETIDGANADTPLNAIGKWAVTFAWDAMNHLARVTNVGGVPTLPKLETYADKRRALNEALLWCEKHSAPQGTADDASTPAVQVDIKTRTVTLRGVTHDVRSEQAIRWLKVLVDHPREWLAAGDLSRHDPGLQDVRTDKLRRHLPESVQRLIESETGKGSRITMP